jgi:hypothetical protein
MCGGIAPGEDIVAAVSPPGNHDRDFDMYDGASCPARAPQLGRGPVPGQTFEPMVEDALPGRASRAASCRSFVPKP